MHNWQMLMQAAVVALACSACARTPGVSDDRGLLDGDVASADAGGPGDPLDFLPSHVGLRAAFEDGLGSLVVGADGHLFWVVDSTTGAITSYVDSSMESARVVRAPGQGTLNGVRFGSVAIADGRSLGTFTLAGFEVLPATTCVIVGDRPAVFLVWEDILIDGFMTAGADRIPNLRGPGPGGYWGGTNGGSSGEGPGAGSPGAGGSFGGLGGKSGDAATPGLVYGDSVLELLEGGSGGGAGSKADAVAGNGGGALQLSARRSIVVGLSGMLDAGGSGGRGTYQSAGGGGGSGGALFLEAPKVEITGFVGANGGAGGQAEGPFGSHGEPDIVPAPASPTEGRSGGGGAGSGAGGCAGDGADADIAGGGGGGGGRVVIRTSSDKEHLTLGVTPTLSSGLYSVLPLSES
ncbi:MAG: hypothetical protein JRH20_16805 [Deltaproteobacteria bacterium]|nr:hypothetical protein [Deltaproteobacteria bacterium]